MDRLTSLRLFREVVEAGSFARAAEAMGLSAPMGVADDVVAVINRAMNEASDDSDFRDKVSKFGMTPRGSTSEAMRSSMEREIAKWAEVIDKAGLAPN